MKGKFENEVVRMQQRRKKRVIWTRFCLLLACAVAIGTFYALTQPARTEEAELSCTLEEHQHSDACYAQVLVCSQEDEEHEHSVLCYASELVCTLEEHTHTPECYVFPLFNTTDLTEETEEKTLSAETAQVSEAVDLQDEPVADESGIVPEESSAPAEFDTESADPQDDPGPIGTDIAQYIKSVSVQRLENGEYVTATVFENGDLVRVFITYDIPRAIVTPDSKQVYYQLPEGINLLEAASGDVLDKGRSVGIYTITTSGLIQITFKDEFANGNAISGTVGFSGVVSANGDGSDREVHFDGEGGSITVIVPDTQKYDLSIAKSGDFTGSGFHNAEYHIVVSSEKGSGSEVTVTDSMSVATPLAITDPRYDPDSFVLWHVAADGTRTQVSPVPVTVSADGLSFEIPGLPALAANEQYDLTYEVNMNSDLDHSGELHNGAVASTSTLSASTSYVINYTSDISKQGSFNLSSGLIDWVITVNPDGRDVSGWSIHDDLPYPAASSVLLTTGFGSVFADLTPADGKTINYTFPVGSPATTYYIRYSTQVLGSEETVRNEVTLTNEDTVTVSAAVSVEERQETVDKQAGPHHVRLDGLVETNWNFVINLPPTELTSYYFRDNISSQVLDVETGDFISNSQHYGIASQIDEALRGNLRLVSDGKNYYYGDTESIVDFEVVYYSGSTVVPADDSITHITRFTVTVNPRNGRSFHGYQIVASDYPTLLDTSSAVLGDYWSYQNYLYLQNGMYDMAPSFYRKGNVFEKQVLFDNAYTGEDVTVGFPECGGVLNYRLLIDLSAVTTDAIEVVDHLPAGLALIPDSEKINYYNSALNIAYTGNFSQDGSFISAVTENEDGTSDIVFNAYYITEAMRSRYAYICISYKAKLTDGSKWNDYTEAQETFSNTSTWDDHSTRQDTTVFNLPKRLEKTGEQMFDESGKPCGVVRYRVIINAGEEDLDPDSAQIVLTDTISANAGTELDINSIYLYEYDRNTEDHIGAYIPRYLYSMQIDDQTGVMSLTLNDEHAYVFVYEYDVNAQEIIEGTTFVNNSISLSGIFSSDVSLGLKNVDSSATAWQSVVTVIKVDGLNYSKVLPGAEFKLSYREPATGEWIYVQNSETGGDVFVTDKNGKFVLTLSGTDQNLVPGKLYRLSEIKAPVGYEGSERDLYFIIKLDTAQSNQDVYQTIAADSGIQLWQIRFYGPTGGTMLVNNLFKGLTVIKRWEDPSGAEINDPDRSEVTLTLYQSTDPAGTTGREPVSAEYVVNPVVVTPDDNGEWQYTWNALRETDDSGQRLYYFIEETTVSGYEPIYPTVGAVPGSTVILTNRMMAFVLPDTGSSGVTGYLLMGAVLLAFAFGFAILLKRRPAEGGKSNH